MSGTKEYRKQLEELCNWTSYLTLSLLEIWKKEDKLFTVWKKIVFERNVGS